MVRIKPDSRSSDYRASIFSGAVNSNEKDVTNNVSVCMLTEPNEIIKTLLGVESL